MRPLPLILAAILAAGSLEAADVRAAAARLGVREGGTVLLRSDGRIGEWRELRASLPGDPARAALDASRLLGEALRDPADGAELRVDAVQESLTGTHVRLAQWVGGERVIEGEAVFRFDRRGEIVGISNGFAAPLETRRAFSSRQPEAWGARTIVEESRVLLAHERSIRRARRVVAEDPPHGLTVWYVDSASGETLKVEPHWFAVAGRVFESNPVTALNDPSLRDQNDSALAVPEAAYRTVELLGLGAGPGLSGPHVQVLELESPKTAPADAAASGSYDRSQHGFEEVMAYYHLDRSQRWLQSLGYSGARQIIRAPLRVDAHAASGADASYYRFGASGNGSLYFGDGGVDDAEDPDILVHEYGHAIQDAIAPFAFAGSFSSQARAMGEGFGDYWAFSYGYAASVDGARDPYCIADWDARCGGDASSQCGYAEGADCLRRVDSPKTMAGYQLSERSGIEHQNGEIWSSALREIFMSLLARFGQEGGRRTADTLVIESMFGLPPAPTFRAVALRMLEVDRLLYASANRIPICGAMTGRGILAASDCNETPRGDLVQYPAPSPALAIPDNTAAGVESSREITAAGTIRDLRVRVRIRHPHRGDLRIVLAAPDGREATLQNPSADSGSDIDAVYGFEVESSDPLEMFRGAPAAGRWTLRVVDTGAADEGMLLSWALILRLESSAPLLERPAAPAARTHLAAVAEAAGANGTKFVSDVRLLNRGFEDAYARLIFTPSAADGRTAFAAFDVVLAPGQQVALDDVVGREFRLAGVGTLEVQAPPAVLVTSRTYNDAVEGTFGQFVDGVAPSRGVAAAEPAIHLPFLRNDAAFRTNIGFAEVAGREGVLAWSVYDEMGRPIEEGSATIAPWSHMQVPLLGGFGGQLHPMARAEARVTSGGARVVAYASVVDNASGDAVYLPATPALDPGARLLPAVIRGDGANGTKWRSDVWLTALGSPGRFRLAWASPEGVTVESTVEVGAGASVRIDDLLASRFGVDAGTGSLTVTAEGSAWLLASRTWTEGSRGSFGQSIPPAELMAAGEGARVIPHLVSDGTFRTNLGLAEASGRRALVSVSLVDGSGAPLWETVVEIPAGGHRQLSLPLVAPPFLNGYAWVEVIEGDGRVAAYGSVVDNRTGDPVFIPMR